MDISAVAKKTQIPASTLRYYEEIGLIESIGRRGIKRVFLPSVLEKLSLIELGQAAGFKLSEIKQMFTKDGELALNREFLLKKSRLIEKEIRRLKYVSKTIKHAANCTAESHLKCPKFRQLMKDASIWMA